MMTWARNGPSVGEIIEVEPVHFSSNNNVLGKNPIEWGGKHVLIETENLHLVFPKETREAINAHRGPFRLTSVDEPHPAIITGKDNGSLRVRYVTEEVKDESEGPSYEFETPEHDEPIEWEGTPQEIDESQASNRREIFTEEDRRGSKNDLL